MMENFVKCYNAYKILIGKYIVLYCCSSSFSVTVTEIFNDKENLHQPLPPVISVNLHDESQTFGKRPLFSCQK